jgi:hypothetical protein
MRGEHIERMSPDDSIVWGHFLAQGGCRGAVLHYQVRLGNGCFDASILDPVAREIWRAQCSKRADAVAQFEKCFAVIEVKPVASMTALGQALSYQYLFAEEEKPTLPVEAWVVCGQTDADLVRIYEHYRVRLFVV